MCSADLDVIERLIKDHPAIVQPMIGKNIAIEKEWVNQYLKNLSSIEE